MRYPTLLVLAALCTAFAKTADAQNVPRAWNEQLLEAIREDFARPTVHARNLYHTSIALYDAWAVYDDEADTHFLGKGLGTYDCPLVSFPLPADRAAAQREAMSYAAYRLLRYRFRQSPGRSTTWFKLDSVLVTLGYDPRVTSNDYSSGDPAALGNYLGSQLIAYGTTDGSNDAADYANTRYEPVNPPLIMDEPGNPDIVDPDRWQPLSLSVFIDQSGNPIPGGMQDFLGPEWGQVVPFALDRANARVETRDSFDYVLYHDPGPPPYISDPDTRERYQRGFEMVAIWSGLLDPADGTTIDISPGAIGRNVDPLPQPADYYDYYDEFGGGDSTGGLAINPVTDEPYAPNVVKRGDYGRVLAEYWADGPDSETPPGHWFTLLNYVVDQPGFTPRWRGQGPLLDATEYLVKAYLTLGGAMHDAAIATWGIKGWYDYLRPVSAIRYMAERGQRSDPTLPRYHPHGLRLEPGFIEFVDNIDDPLAGPTGENIGEIKLYAWRGPDFIVDPATDVAGTGWILAKEWWPYQRPTFVSPPFAGYISGHSTYSRAAAEILTAMTGSAYFPGGLGTFEAPMNEFLVFEDGPSETVQLQWATYRDASDEVSLSRIFGGIHPPADDIPGRRIGIIVAADAFAKAQTRFDTVAPTVTQLQVADTLLASNAGQEVDLVLTFSEPIDQRAALDLSLEAGGLSLTPLSATWNSDTEATVRVRVGDEAIDLTTSEVRIASLTDLYANVSAEALAGEIVYDTRRPTYVGQASASLLTADDIGDGTLSVDFAFDEAMDTSVPAQWTLPSDFPTGVLGVASEAWSDDRTYEITFDVAERQAEYADVRIDLSARDFAGNGVASSLSEPLFSVDIEASSVRQLAHGAEARVFPNPVRDVATLRLTGEATGQLVLRDATGRQVLAKAVGAGTTTLNFADLAAGAYALTLTSAGESVSWRLLKD